MKNHTEQDNFLSCACGKTKMPVTGDAIMSVACYCTSCQTAAEVLSGDEPARMKGADGGTHFVLYRKDFVHSSDAAEMLSEYRLTPESSTRRVLSVCCGTPMFLEFENGHWLSVYAARVAERLRPPIQCRTMIKDAPPTSQFIDGIPSYKTHSLQFMGRLVWAWVKMGFRAPDVAVRGPRIGAAPHA